MGRQKSMALLPVHNQIMQENESMKEFIMMAIILNTIAIFTILGIWEICKCGCRRMRDLMLEVGDFRASQNQNQAQEKNQVESEKNGK